MLVFFLNFLHNYQFSFKTADLIIFFNHSMVFKKLFIIENASSTSI